MGLTSLWLFTLLGGLAVGLNLFETCFTRKREGERPWLIPLVVVILFTIGLLASITHIHSLSNAIAVVGAGTINFSAGMVWEVFIALLFWVLALIDLILVGTKRETGFGIRVATSVAGVLCIVLMATAYINVFGNPVWCNAGSTLLIFIFGALSLGVAAYTVFSGKSYDDKNLKNVSLAVNLVLACGLALEIGAFSSAGISVLLPVISMILAPISSLALVLLNAKIDNNRTVANVVLIVSIIGIALSRYAFYASWIMM